MVFQVSLGFDFVFSFALRIYEKSFQEKVALFKIFISSTKYTDTCVRVCILKHTFSHQLVQFVYKEMTKHLQNILLYVSNANVNTQLHNTTVVLLRKIYLDRKIKLVRRHVFTEYKMVLQQRLCEILNSEKLLLVSIKHMILFF